MTAASDGASVTAVTAQPWLHHRFGDVWLLRTDAQARSTKRTLVPGLPDEVVQRAGRLRDPEQRARHLHAHKALHQMLWPRLERPQWNLSPLGKPDVGPLGPAFNLSRRNAWAAFVIGPDATALGIDLEVIHEIDDPIDLARSHFTSREIAAVRALPEHDRSAAFLRVWTRKEAVMKAVGLGVSLSARSFHVGLEADTVTLRVTHEGEAWDVDLESLPQRDDAIVAVARAVVVARN